VLSAGNRDMLRVIAERTLDSLDSLDELAQLTGRTKSDLSRALKAMAGQRLMRLERGVRRWEIPPIMSSPAPPTSDGPSSSA